MVGGWRDPRESGSARARLAARGLAGRGRAGVPRPRASARVAVDLPLRQSRGMGRGVDEVKN
jgi:hypothetical protein